MESLLRAARHQGNRNKPFQPNHSAGLDAVWTQPDFGLGYLELSGPVNPLLYEETTGGVIAHYLFFLFSVAYNGFSLLYPPHFRILLLNRGSLQITLWCIMWMQKSCHSLHAARYNMTLFGSCVWSRDQQCNRGNPDSRLDITSNLLLTFPFFFPLLLVYLFIPISEHHVPSEYFTSIFHYMLSLPPCHPPSLTLCLHVIILIYFRNNFLANYSKMATAVIRG